MIGNIKSWIENFICDINKILFEKLGYPNKPHVWFDVLSFLLRLLLNIENDSSTTTGKPIF